MPRLRSELPLRSLAVSLSWNGRSPLPNRLSAQPQQSKDCLYRQAGKLRLAQSSHSYAMVASIRFVTRTQLNMGTAKFSQCAEKREFWLTRKTASRSDQAGEAFSKLRELRRLVQHWSANQPQNQRGPLKLLRDKGAVQKRLPRSKARSRRSTYCKGQIQPQRFLEETRCPSPHCPLAWRTGRCNRRPILHGCSAPAFGVFKASAARIN